MRKGMETISTRKCACAQCLKCFSQDAFTHFALALFVKKNACGKTCGLHKYGVLIFRLENARFFQKSKYLFTKFYAFIIYSKLSLQKIVTPFIDYTLLCSFCISFLTKLHPHLALIVQLPLHWCAHVSGNHALALIRAAKQSALWLSSVCIKCLYTFWRSYKSTNVWYYVYSQIILSTAYQHNLVTALCARFGKQVLIINHENV